MFTPPLLLFSEPGIYKYVAVDAFLSTFYHSIYCSVVLSLSSCHLNPPLSSTLRLWSLLSVNLLWLFLCTFQVHRSALSSLFCSTPSPPFTGNAGRSPLLLSLWTSWFHGPLMMDLSLFSFPHLLFVSFILDIHNITYKIIKCQALNSKKSIYTWIFIR